jgi:conjugal transfer pilus assembly protein TraW
MAHLLSSFIFRLLVCHIALYSSLLYGKDFGVQGTIFPIREENFLHYLESKYKSLSQEERANLDNGIKGALVKKINEPLPVDGIEDASDYKRFYFDPTARITEDINDEKGNVIVAKGSSVNPLERVSLGESLLFIDGSKENQIIWAQANEGKWILVKGRPMELEKKLNRPVYFDQFAFLCKKMGIRKTPCRVTQEGLRLLIEEVPIDQEGKEYE